MPKRGYRPKYSRAKLPLTVEAQRKLLGKAEGEVRALFLLMLSTGMHPKVLSQTKKYGLTWDNTYYAWKRTKTMKPVQGAWSKAMRDGNTLQDLWEMKGHSRQWYHRVLRELGKEAGVAGLCPLQLRHTFFVNRARLGHNAYDIAHGAATGMEVIYNYYTIGMGEAKALKPEDREWLQWLIEA